MNLSDDDRALIASKLAAHGMTFKEAQLWQLGHFLDVEATVGGKSCRAAASFSSMHRAMAGASDTIPWAELSRGERTLLVLDIIGKLRVQVRA